MKLFYAFFTCALLFWGCASENPNIVNPPPGNANVSVRFFNMVPDNSKRALVLELGRVTTDVAPGRMSSTIDAPSDSSFLEILGNGTREYYSTERYKFIRQSVYDVFAIASHANPESFDTIFVSNANTSLTTLPVAQVRVVNVVPDTSISIDVRRGCPNGLPLNNFTVRFATSSLYSDSDPGNSVFSVVENRAGGSVLLGTFECLLKEYMPYSIIAYRNKGTPKTQIMLLEEQDSTPNADRSFTPILSRTAEVRVVNVSNQSVSVIQQTLNTSIANNLSSNRISDYIELPTCESEQSDIFQVTFSNGDIVVDSTALIVRKKFTVVCADSGTMADMLIVAPAATIFDTDGKAIVRVVNMSTTRGNIVLSTAARTDSDQPSNFTSGFTLADNVSYRSVSKPTAIKPGQVPITIATASKPTKFIQVSRVDVIAGHDYLFVVSEQNGEFSVSVIDETESNTAVTKAQPAVLTRVLNGSPTNSSEMCNLHDVIVNAKLFYRNSLTTTVPSGSVNISIGGASKVLTSELNKRLLCIYAEGGNSANIISFSADPLVPSQGKSLRRFINATADIKLISVAFDSVPAQNPDAEHIAKDIAYGTSSVVFEQQTVRRGSIFFYDSDEKTSLFSLPIDFGPLGNNYSLIIVGRKQSGYEVIVTQEF
ncbi:MAG: DUF4397 domain-containing protein [Ignavibacteria bacterium]|nr:DUF4397 domain-containing protein [Ignavibacteria bacterium]